MQAPPEPDVTLDALGLACPMPLLKAKKALNGMASGQVLHVRATDPGSVRDFEVFCRQSGHELLGTDREGDEFRYWLRCR
jgi:tRNA 2-thiouridine synthesizing protein A